MSTQEEGGIDQMIFRKTHAAYRTARLRHARQ